jgi:hypothetical protein
MRTRFPKVWCEACKSMQFAGECGHARTEPPDCSTGLAVRLNRADCAALEAAARRAVLPGEIEHAIASRAAERRAAAAEGLPGE